MRFCFFQHQEVLSDSLESISDRCTFFIFHFELFIGLNILNIMNLFHHSIRIYPIIATQNFKALKVFLL